MSVFESDARKFGWSSLVHVVPINATGEATSIIKNYTTVNILQVRKQARSTWGDMAADFNDELPASLGMTDINRVDIEVDHGHFYYRIKSTMIAKCIKGSFEKASIKALFNQKRKFTWTDHITSIEELDGPTMLQIIV